MVEPLVLLPLVPRPANDQQPLRRSRRGFARYWAVSAGNWRPVWSMV